MQCPLCPTIITEQSDSHHDHLRDLAIRVFRSHPGVPPRGSDGARIDRLTRLPGVQSNLRFTGRVKCCQACNGLENAWKIESNVRGFLPKDFSLTPAEISKVRALRKPANSSEVHDALRRIWLEERRLYQRRARIISWHAARFAEGK